MLYKNVKNIALTENGRGKAQSAPVSLQSYSQDLLFSFTSALVSIVLIYPLEFGNQILISSQNSAIKLNIWQILMRLQK